jgi:hypothetical protein
MNSIEPLERRSMLAGVTLPAHGYQGSNITFADNYWRTDGEVNNFDFDGEPVAGAHEGDLNSSVQQDEPDDKADERALTLVESLV